MPPLLINEQIISGTEPPRLGLVLELHAGAARDHQHPFGPALVVPEACRAGLAGGDDTFDPDAGQPQDILENLLRPGAVKPRQQVAVGAVQRTDPISGMRTMSPWGPLNSGASARAAVPAGPSRLVKLLPTSLWMSLSPFNTAIAASSGDRGSG